MPARANCDVLCANCDLLCALLAGSWRGDPPPAILSAAELEAVAPLLHGSGAAGLGWWRLRQSTLAPTPVAHGLQQAYRLQVLRNAAREAEIRELFAELSAARLDALLVKGWAAARTYADPGLRPYGDIDLLVRPSHRAAARQLLHGREAVDLDHADFDGMGEQSADAFFQRSQADGEVRFLGADDHLHLICAHFLRHGGWRPLWLCDIAAAVERGANPRSREAECCATLAHRMLGARVPETVSLPGWFPRTVRAQWNRALYSAHELPGAIADSWWRLPQSLRRRWPDPITASALTGAPFNRAPRLVFQLAYYGILASRYLRRLRSPRRNPA